MTDVPAEAVSTVLPESKSIAQLVAALSKVQGEMPAVNKSKTARIQHREGGGEHSYKYADLADVAAAIMPLLSKNGLAFICLPEEAGRGFILRGILAHESGETIEGFLPIYGNELKAMGSSLTYGRRYLLGTMTGIVTDEDDDGTAGNDSGRATKAPSRQRQSKEPPQQAPAEPAGPPIEADDSWRDKIADAVTFDELTAVYNEADAAKVMGHMLGDETVKARLYARRNELTAKDAQ